MLKEFFLFVKNTVDIVDVVGHYVSLTQIGNYYKGLSPFKQEKTPSFTITPEKKIFYCFSTHVGGDVIDFVSRIENCSQYEAASLLIERYQIHVDTKFFSKNKTDQEENNYFKIYRLFIEFCRKKFKENFLCQKYLLDRGVFETSFEKFNIGYCPGSESIREFIGLINKQGILNKEIEKTHLIQESKAKKFFTAEKRIIFPITNVMNLFCGYGARTYLEEDPRAKYINSINSIEFIKKNLLYNFSQAKMMMKKTKAVYFVEGFLDVILMSQIGYENTVATMGTAPTKNHIDLVKKFVEHIILVYDGDAAGKNALIKFVSLCWNEDVDVQLVLLPHNEDPASLVKKGQFESILDNKISAIDFFVNEKKEAMKTNSLKEMHIVLEDILILLNSIKDEKKKIILKLKISFMLDISHEVLERLMNNTLKNLTDTRTMEVKNEANKIEKQNENIIKQTKEQNEWYIFFNLTLFFYNPKDELTKKSIMLFEHFSGDKLKIILNDFQDFYKKNQLDYLEFFKIYNEKLYDYSMKMINMYSFSKEQYAIIYKKIFQYCWIEFKKNNINKSFQDFNEIINIK